MQKMNRWWVVKGEGGGAGSALCKPSVHKQCPQTNSHDRDEWPITSALLPVPGRQVNVSRTATLWLIKGGPLCPPPSVRSSQFPSASASVLPFLAFTTSCQGHWFICELGTPYSVDRRD